VAFVVNIFVALRPRRTRWSRGGGAAWTDSLAAGGPLGCA